MLTFTLKYFFYCMAPHRWCLSSLVVNNESLKWETFVTLTLDTLTDSRSALSLLAFSTKYPVKLWRGWDPTSAGPRIRNVYLRDKHTCVSPRVQRDLTVFITNTVHPYLSGDKEPNVNTQTCTNDPLNIDTGSFNSRTSPQLATTWYQCMFQREWRQVTVA